MKKSLGFGKSATSSSKAVASIGLAALTLLLIPYIYLYENVIFMEKTPNRRSRPRTRHHNVKKISLVFVTASSANHMSALLLDNLPSIEKWVLNTTTPTFLQH